MPTRQQTDQYIRSQNELVRMAKRDLAAMWRHLDQSSARALERELRTLYPALVAQYGQVSRALAIEWLRGILGSHALPAAPSGGMALERLGRGIGLADSDGGLTVTAVALANYLDAAIKQWGRDTIAESSYRAGVGWARVPSGAETCAFCWMLASRGFTYASRETAGYGNSYHDDCDCVPTPDDGVTPAGYDPDALYDAYNEAAYRALGGSPRSGEKATKSILAQMRRDLPTTDHVSE